MEQNSSEQWDFPNGWAPQQHLFVVSLQRCENNTSAESIVKKVVNSFLTTTYNGFFNPTEGKVFKSVERLKV